jgi:hypothetical protein
VRVFPNTESCLRLVRALAVEMHENWLEATRYLNMDHLKEHKKRGPAGLGRLTAAGRGRCCATRGLRAATPHITRAFLQNLTQPSTILHSEDGPPITERTSGLGAGNMPNAF